MDTSWFVYLGFWQLLMYFLNFYHTENILPAIIVFLHASLISPYLLHYIR